MVEKTLDGLCQPSGSLSIGGRGQAEVSHEALRAGRHKLVRLKVVVRPQVLVETGVVDRRTRIEERFHALNPLWPLLTRDNVCDQLVKGFRGTIKPGSIPMEG